MFLRIRVVPDAKKETVTKVGETEYHITVREPAERNCANGRVREIVAALYHVDMGNIRIVSGHRSRTKVISVNT